VTDLANQLDSAALPQTRPAAIPQPREEYDLPTATAPARADRRQPGRRFLAAARSLVEWPFEFLARDLLGLEIGERRGYVDLCAICLRDVHDAGEVCPEAFAGDCDVCGTVNLDRFGNCPSPRWRFHRVANRRRRFEASQSNHSP